ncbi:SDR family oxidoreductase [Sphingobium sufflavum]|uniref:SDR family oxidoreductase n=1 Tax=Sphingobium sufflavum TaxID=1129547 RepID=UPI001F3FB2E3|nr:SDR family oxidoreductase [Sphingobium sufflavum]MCE7797719.1 SDR family oxidoreductase [Sphingobium sufflavum]
MTGWTTADLLPQTGHYCVITGATGGIGLETALALAGAGCMVLLTGRDPGKGVRALTTIRAAHPDAQVAFALCDVASLSSVNRFADGLVAAGRPLDMLINNAGVMALPRRELTVDGHEAQFGTNVVGHYRLTARLMPLLRAAASPRVVQLASLAHLRGRIVLDDLDAEQSYDPWTRYQQSKLAMLLFALELQRRSDSGGWGVTSLAAHPGLASTNLFRRGPRESLYARLRTAVIDLFCQSGAAGAWPTLMAATAPDVTPGGYYGPTGFMETRGPAGPARIGPNARDAALAAQLWDRLAAMTGAVWPEG